MAAVGPGAAGAATLRQRRLCCASGAGFARAAAHSSRPARRASEEQLHAHSRLASGSGPLRRIRDRGRNLGRTPPRPAVVDGHSARRPARRVERWHHPCQCRRRGVGRGDDGARHISPASPPALEPTTRLQAFPPNRAGPAPLPQSSAERERALGLHAKGVEQLERGNVFAARKFFEHATAAGLAQSAVALAGTYDPDELAKIKIVGLQPNIEEARKWYEKARELGAVEASERLRRLGAR